MPRHARLLVPGLPFHVVQRGVNKGAIFFDDQDREHFLRVLHKAFVKYGVALHAYVLMGNHVHLLATPRAENSLAFAMRALGNGYVQAFNQRHGRCGPLWQGRFHSSLIDHDRYLLAVYRYIELNPVRAGLVDRAEQHRWSSVHGNLGLRRDPLLVAHPAYRALGDTPTEITSRYHTFLQDSHAQDDAATIRQHERRQSPLGDERFLEMLRETLGQSVAMRCPGRPRKEGLHGTGAR
ncbi:transposase [Stenotrophomonas sp. 169]|uniref:transposase n=1 Tax=Stenotrophomonas sp. 169 TaxID=2770322 RepID=UPI00166225A2|nr:transposase [Stenotrophomonas sp. 169]QNR97178.1 transposase [Stenotrophomonas sp. 169]